MSGPPKVFRNRVPWKHHDISVTIGVPGSGVKPEILRGAPERNGDGPAGSRVLSVVLLPTFCYVGKSVEDNQSLSASVDLDPHPHQFSPVGRRPTSSRDPPGPGGRRKSSGTDQWSLWFRKREREIEDPSRAGRSARWKEKDGKSKGGSRTSGRDDTRYPNTSTPSTTEAHGGSRRLRLGCDLSGAKVTTRKYHGRVHSQPDTSGTGLHKTPKWVRKSN